MSTRYLVLDTETTGLEPRQGHKIIEIGCVELIDRHISGKTYQQFLNPERDIDEGALEVHGIELSVLEGKPTFAEIADDFLAYIKDATLIIHNAAFDVGFLNHEMALLERNLGVITDYCEVLDTLVMARQKHPGQRNSLDALCQRYFIDNQHRTLHGALLDSEILAEVYLGMTGGQLKLLDEPDLADSSSGAGLAVQPADPNRAPIKIIPANDEALAAHQKWLDMLSESKGETVNWYPKEGNKAAGAVSFPPATSLSLTSTPSRRKFQSLRDLTESTERRAGSGNDPVWYRPIAPAGRSRPARVAPSAASLCRLR